MGVRETSAEIDAAAAEWAVRVDRGPLAQAEQAALDAWLAEDIRRRGAFARAQAMFVHARRTKALGPEFDADAYLARHDSAAPDGVGVLQDVESGPASRRRFLMLGGSAAAAVACGVIALGFGLGTPAEAYATRKGEVRLVPLNDGSQMTLNTATSTEVLFSKKERHVELAAGEALFDVAHDAARPFIVVAGDTTVRATGTSFTVRRLPGQPVQVLVREGAVEISSLSRSAATRIVRANTRAIAAASQPVEVAPVAPAEVGRALAWREGKLAFEDQPLAKAAAEFARYSDRRIEFADPALGEETITGLYAANDPLGFARSAALSLGLRAETTEKGVRITR